MAAIRKISVSTGIFWVEIPEADIRLLCGCPVDSVKHLLRMGLILSTEVNGMECQTGPNAILLSDLAVQNGRPCNRSEFPVLPILEVEMMMNVMEDSVKDESSQQAGPETQDEVEMQAIREHVPHHRQ